MTDEQPNNDVRRVGRKNQKDRLQPGRLPDPEPAADDFPDEVELNPDELAALEDVSRAALPPEKPATLPDGSAQETKQMRPATETQDIPPADVPYAPPSAYPMDYIDEPQDDIETVRVDLPERWPPANPDVVVPPPPTTRKPPPSKPKQNRGRALANVVTGTVVLLTVGFVAYVIYVWQEPFTPLNPFAPPTPLPIFVSETPLPPTATVTATPVPVSPTVAEAVAPVVVRTNDPDTTPTLPGNGDTSPTPPPAAQESVDPASAPASEFAFVISEPGVIYAPNANDKACNWSSIAGTVVDLNGAPINGLRVSVDDALTGEDLGAVFTGGSVTFGDGGFEYPLGETPLQNPYNVQLLTSAGLPVSEVQQVITSERCNQNVAIINFEQIAEY